MTLFFESKKGAAVLKHSLLSYIYPFAMKTGAYSDEHRVAVIDGYAGEGRYEDGEDGSPLRLIDVARRAAAHRRLELHLIEKDPTCFAKLEAAVAAKLGSTPDVPVMRYRGSVEQQLGLVLTQTSGIPLFVFLDPFGFVAPFDAIGTIFARPRGLGTPATEALINFSMRALNRTAGHLDKPTAVPATLARMDEVCGGDWWRQVWRDHIDESPEAAQHAVVTEYARQMSKIAGTGWWAVDVLPRPGLQPVYYLIFLSRHPDGLDIFGERVSIALSEWRAWVTRQSYAETMFDDEAIEKTILAEEANLTRQWVARITANLTGMLDAGVDNFSIMNRYGDVFDGVIGQARDKHLRKVLKQLYADGVLLGSPVGVEKLKRYVVRRAPGPEA